MEPLGPVPLRRNRDFQLLWGGRAVSLLGYLLFALPSGGVADRYDRKRLMIVALQIAWGVIPLGSLLAGVLLQALSPSAVVAAGMTVTAIAATALAPVRDAGRGTPGASPGTSGPSPAGATDAAPATG